MKNKDILFVPGRLCLIGGISDLVVPYLSENKELQPGSAIAMRLDKGIYSYAEKSNKFIYSFNDVNYECKMEENKLENEANSDSFFSYMCGTLLYLLRNYKGKIKGMKLKITNMDLPIKKGLASSAAICITIVKHMNRLYNLNLTDDDIINIAYNGEHLAGSKCGILDQTTIVKGGIIHLTFLENETKVKQLNVKDNINVLAVDLNATKDTKQIMNFFNEEMSKVQKNKSIIEFFGNNNNSLVNSAIYYIEQGNAKDLGDVFFKFQDNMDKFGDYCSELKAPILHSILNDEYINKNIYGAKGCGSGGDGSVILVCKDSDTRNNVSNYLKNTYNMSSIKIDIN